MAVPVNERRASEAETVDLGHGKVRANTDGVDDSDNEDQHDHRDRDVAMRSEEIGRVRAFAYALLALAGFGIILLPLLGGDPFAKKIFFSVPFIAIALGGWLLWVTSQPARYRDWHFAAVALIGGVIAIAPLYYFGPFSPFPIVIAIGIYTYAMSSAQKLALINIIMQVSFQAALVGLILTDVIRDRGLVHAEYLSATDRLLLQLAVLFLYINAFALGRMNRRKLVEATDALETAVRKAALQGALVAEARAELHRPRVGGPGRYTDRKIDEFEIGNLIGRGAMGEVYEAKHAKTGEIAAIKLLFPNIMAATDHVERFIRESRAVAALNVPNVVDVIAIPDKDAAFPYLAMERLSGHDLSYYLHQKDRLPATDVVDLVKQVAAALQAAQTAGIVHRDLKPQNVFLHEADDEPVWKVLDFGASKLIGAGDELTHGHIIGTPSYMSAEQARGSDVDHRADVYALAAIAYRALTGHPLYQSTTVEGVLYDVVNTMPAPPSKWTEGHRDVDRVFAIALAKSANHRFENAQALAAALSQSVAGELAPHLRTRGERMARKHGWKATRN